MCTMGDERKEAGYYTEEEIHEMRKLGLEKPDDVSWSRWKAVKKISPRHSLISHLAAAGMSPGKIAKESGMTLSYISILLGDPKIKSEIAYLQRQMFGEDPRKRYNSLMSDAIDVTETIMKNEGEKGSTRLSAAQLIQERVLGKPTQTVDIGTNLIRTLFERLDQKEKEKEASPLLDVTPNQIETSKPETPIAEKKTLDDNEIEVEAVSIEKEEPTELDLWIEKNLEGKK